jgi:hypothetical protein
MAKGKGLSTTAKVLIASAVVIGAGVGLYLILKKKKKGEESGESSGSTDLASGSGGGAKEEKKVIVPAQCKPKKAPTELKTAGLVADFQEWLDKTHPLWYKDNKTGKYTNICVKNVEGKVLDSGKYCGQYGCGTEKAWGIWGGEYVKSKSNATTTTTTTAVVSQDAPKIDIFKVEQPSSLAYLPTYKPVFFTGDDKMIYEPSSSFTAEQMDLDI